MLRAVVRYTHEGNRLRPLLIPYFDGLAQRVIGERLEDAITKTKARNSKSISGFVIGDFPFICGLKAITHSLRRAISGSTFVARRAGTQQASSATITNSADTAANVSGSVAFTP